MRLLAAGAAQGLANAAIAERLDVRGSRCRSGASASSTRAWRGWRSARGRAVQTARETSARLALPGVVAGYWTALTAQTVCRWSCSSQRTLLGLRRISAQMVSMVTLEASRFASSGERLARSGGWQGRDGTVLHIKHTVFTYSGDEITSGGAHEFDSPVESEQKVATGTPSGSWITWTKRPTPAVWLRPVREGDLPAARSDLQDERVQRLER